MADLSRFLDLDKSSVTGLVESAERRGLVTRQLSDTDRRVSVVDITSAGGEVIEATSREFARDLGELVGRLPARDRAELAELSTRLLVANARANGVDLVADLVSD